MNGNKAGTALGNVVLTSGFAWLSDGSGLVVADDDTLLSHTDLYLKREPVARIATVVFALSVLLSLASSPSTHSAHQIALGMPALDAASKDSAIGGQGTLCIRADYCGDGV